MSDIALTIYLYLTITTVTHIHTHMHTQNHCYYPNYTHKKTEAERKEVTYSNCNVSAAGLGFKPITA